MKCYVKDFSNSLDSNRERVAYTTLGTLLFEKNSALTLKRG